MSLKDNPELQTLMQGRAPLPADDLNGYIYLATPYSHPEPKVMEARRLVTAAYAADLANRGQKAFAPIVYSHALVAAGAQPDSWYAYDLFFLEKAAAMTLLTLPGWEESQGLLLEIAYAKALRKEITYAADWQAARQRLNLPPNALTDGA